MTEWITATFEHGVFVPTHVVDLHERQTVRLQVVPPQIRVTAAAAQRRVSHFVLDQVSYLMGAERPALVGEERPVWRVPVVLTNPRDGLVGQVGTVDVDAETGDLLLDPDGIEALQRQGRALVAGSPPPTNS